MNTEIPTYLPGGKHVSSSIGAFVNYFGPAPDKESALQECESRVGAACVIIDGDDNWNSPFHKRPQTWVDRGWAKPVAWFHSGVSGITKSGFIIRASDLPDLIAKWDAAFPERAGGFARDVRVTYAPART